jgi:two-component system, sensor histidine kinase and response regulator
LTPQKRINKTLPVVKKRGQEKLLKLNPSRDKKLQKFNDHNFYILAETSPSAILIYDKENVFYVNDSAEKITGHTKEELLKMKFWDLLHPDEKIMLKKRGFDRLTGKQALSSYELRVITKDNTIRYINYTASLSEYKGKTVAIGVANDITEKKHIEQQIRENEEGYRTLFEGANDAIFIMQGGLFISCNEKTLQIFKCTTDQIIGKSPILFSPPFQPDGRPSKESAEEKIKNAYLGVPQYFEWKHTHYDGTSFDAEVGLNKLEVQGIPYLQAIVRDITERKKAEEAIKTSESNLRNILEMSNISMAIVSFEGIIEYINRQVIITFGYSHDEIPDMDSWWRLAYPEENYRKKISDQWIGYVNKAIREKSEIERGEYLVTCKDGTVKTMIIFGIIVNDKAFVMFEDITARKKIETALRESESRYRSYIDNAPDGVLVLDYSGQFIEVNQAFSDAIGYTIDEIKQFTIRDLLSEESLKNGLAHFNKIIETGSAKDDLMHVHKDGSKIWLTVNAVKLSETKLLGFVKDITIRKKAEENLEKFKFIVDNTGEEFYLVRPDGSLEYVNQAAADSLGYSVDELLQLGVPGISLSFHSPEEYYKHFLQLKENDFPAYESLHRTKDGRILTKLVKAVYLLMGDKEYICGFANDISETKKASDLISQNEEKFRLLFTSTSQAVTLNEIILDKDGIPCDYRILEANPAFEEHTGLILKDFIGKKVLDVLPDTEKFWIKEFGDVAMSGQPKRIENYSKELDKYFDFTIYCPRKGQFALISTDITDRKREEESRRLNAHRLEALIRLNNMSDQPLNVLSEYALEEAVKLTGSKYGYLAFMSEDEKIIHLHAWSGEVMNICKVKEQYHQFIVDNTGLLGEPVRCRKTVITNDYAAENNLKHGFPAGHVPITRHMNVPVFDGDKIVILAGVANKESNYNETDVSQLTLLMNGMWRLIQRRKADEALKESEERYRLITNNSNDIIVKFGTNGKISFVSPVCKKLLGYDITDMLKHSVFDFLHPDDIPYIRLYQEKLLKQKAPNIIKHRLRKKDGDYLWFETNNQIINEPDGSIKEIVAVIRDISELLHSEKLIKEKEAAELASKAKSEFLANMSHEIRNPLNSIIGLANSLTRTELDNEQQNFVESLKISSNNLLNILNDILDYSKIEANKIIVQNHVFNLREAVKDIFDSNKTSADFKNINYSYTINDNIPEYILGDPVKFKQILINLTGNAIKFTEKGSISININEISRESDQTFIRIEVTDTGIGIKEEDTSRLFESFSQLDSSTTKSYSGTGLGLAIIKRYAELMNGKVGFSSKFNEGSTFFVELPFTVSDKEKAQDQPKHIEMNEDTTKTLILLVEDDGINQLYLKGFLNKMGYKVDTAFNGVQALEKFNSKKFDLILMDGQMPKMDGFEATRLIREKEKQTQKHTIIIAITGYAVSGDKEKFLKAGMDDYIAKPIDEIRLIELIQQYSRKNQTSLNNS